MMTVNRAAPLPEAFTAPYAAPDEEIAARLLNDASLGAEAEARIDSRATELIGAIRSRRQGAGPLTLGGIEDFLHEYSLSTKEGLALMVLAEALLRVPDAATADDLIEDKLGAADWAHRINRSDAILVSASAWALGLTTRIIQPGETPEGVLASLAKRLGQPAVRTATRQAMRLMAAHFVLGQTIDEALARARSAAGRRFRYSFDMLGEGARTAADADHYFDAYAKAIRAIGGGVTGSLPNRPGISVKLSALHPRYEAISRTRVLAELTPRVIDLARMAKAADLNFTIDAEEADRLELSLDIFAAVVADPSLAGWIGLGLAVQAYQKRALAVIDYAENLAERSDRRLMVRLVKGAYWDSEIKRTQERGLADYPVFTRKAMTDLSYIAAAQKLLDMRPRLYPQFATHNALTIAAILERAGNAEGYEFQRLHGMGEDIYRALLDHVPGLACRIYAPVGGHRDLLAYLVRRLLENGANSSFVSLAADPAVSVSTLLRRPQALVTTPALARHPQIPLPIDLYAPQRRNSAGVEFGSRAALAELIGDIAGALLPTGPAASLLDGQETGGDARPLLSPIDGKPYGAARDLPVSEAASLIGAAVTGFRAWAATPVDARALALERAANLIEGSYSSKLIALLQIEGGKTLDDAIAERREAVDLCRYYAAQARAQLSAGEAMPGPTGEDNHLTYRGRGAFICISPWNFPLAIFLGQIAAALVAGNSVVAKPAEQTPLIGFLAIKLLHEAGIPASALQLALGDGAVGAALCADTRVAGVAFTGSTEVAWRINRALAAKDGPIVPLIAETGGINAMIVDATALPEQVTDDVITSAFRSTGQRCSALRLLCLQKDVADRMIEMIVGAARELKVGDPRDASVHVGPVIDRESKERLEAHIEATKARARLHFAGTLPPRTPAGGLYVAPHLFELAGIDDLAAEVFGPVLHVVRYKAADFDAMLDSIAATGYGLTLGIQSRIDHTVERVIERLNTGNCYVNRNMIGAVVGTQPFGGAGLSGTGPKAGGPNYLKRFSAEQVISINSAASGGNATLLTMGE